LRSCARQPTDRHEHASEALASAAQCETRQIDEKLFLETFAVHTAAGTKTATE
jgi:hypothetical protein